MISSFIPVKVIQILFDIGKITTEDYERYMISDDLNEPLPKLIRNEKTR